MRDPIMPLHVLHLEDDPADAELVQATLEGNGIACQVLHVQNREDFLAGLERPGLDLILGDNSIPGFDGLAALALARVKCPDVPFIFVTGTMGEEVAIATLKGGATDYVLKEKLARLVPAVRRAVRETEEHRERRRAEEELRESQERFRLMVENVKDYAIFMLDPQGNVVTWNAGAAHIMGYSAAQIVGWHFSCLYPREDLERGTPEMELRVAAAEGRFETEGWRVRKDGSHFWANVVLTAVRNRPGQLIGISVVTRDLTERKVAEENAREKQRLEDILHFKSAFIANMSHELRTPLNSIIGFSELLQDQRFGPLTEKQARYVENVLASGQHLLTLINEVLELSKIEAGRIDLQPEAFSLPEAFRDALNTVRPQAAAKRLRLRLEAEEACPKTLIADETRFRQIMYNLLANAVKFTPDGGQVTVSARHVQGSGFAVQGETGIDLEPSTMHYERIKDWVEIAVRDTGIGIKAEDMPKLFQEFSQLDSSLARRYDGTGLGLALTKKLVGLHGGRIWVESPGEGQGSTFVFTVPLQGPDPGPTGAQDSA
jgi:PAS domain S-box-containing protein